MPIFCDEQLDREIGKGFVADLQDEGRSIDTEGENGEFNVAVLDEPTIKRGFGSEKLAKSVGDLRNLKVKEFW